jgi:hypothetical protein
VALFCRRKSVIKEDPISGKQVRALLVQTIDREYDSVVESGDFIPYRGVELLDRSNMSPKDQAVEYMNISNPTFRAVDRETVSPDSHTRRVP